MTDRLYTRPQSIERLADKLEKPLLDNRTYRVIKLPNQLEALLIHDPDTDKASAAMDVNVGSMSDPEEMQGMAHAVEHLLFMGTEKFPEENEYSAYLNRYGGNSNAFTAATSTNYYFELSASSKSSSRGSSANTSEASLPLSKSSKGESPLHGALDRFAQFFVKPLFLEDTLDRELRAVDSENKKNLQSDNWRLMQLSKSLSSPEHPYHLFSTGNYKLLHDDPIARGVKIRDEFIKFYQKQYSANRMRLCVLGRESLDDLQEWVEELFTDVYDQNLPKLRWDDIPTHTEKELCTQVFTKPVMDMRALELMFPYPDEEHLYESLPSRYISHLIGHEGPGSILAYLKEKGWANELSAGAQTICPGAGQFSISLRLTTDGLKHYQEVVKAVFQYIAMVNEQPPQKWIVDESANLAEVEFKFRQKSPASRTVSHLSGVMQKPLPREMLLSGQSLIRKFDPDAIKRGLAALTPRNFRFMLVSKEFPEDWAYEKEKWYGTEYKVEKIPQEFLRQLEHVMKAAASERPSELHLPHKNEFIPTRLEVEKRDILQPALEPKLIRNEQALRVWWKKDDQFWVPKANVNVYLRTPIINSSAFTKVVTQLYKELVDDSLTTYAYDAELAGLEYSLAGGNKALEVAVSGYNDKMHVLLEKVLITLRDLDLKQERFDIIKDRLERSLKNVAFMEPFRQIHTYTWWLSKENAFLGQEMLEELPSVTIDDVRRLYPQILRQMHIEILAHGNLYKEDALRIADIVQSTLKPLPLPPQQWESDRCLILPTGGDFLYQKTLANPDNINHCIEYVVHMGDAQDRRRRAKLLLLGQMMEEPVFDTLRTKEQLGYIVGGGPLVYAGRLAYRILVQSEKDCPYLEKRIDSFLNNFSQAIKDMPETEFEAHRIGMINKRLEKLKNLNQESGRLWHHITSEVFDFELVYRDAEELDTLTKDEIVDSFDAYFKPGSSTRSKHSIHMVAQASAEDIAAKVDPGEQREKLAAKISEILTQLGLAADPVILCTYLEKVDLAKGDVESITTAVGDYLQKVAGVAVEQVESITQQAQAIMPQLLPALGIKAQTDGNANENLESDADGQTDVKSKPVLIEDVRAFKASLLAAPAPAPVKDLSEFEELEPKL